MYLFKLFWGFFAKAIKKKKQKKKKLFFMLLINTFWRYMFFLCGSHNIIRKKMQCWYNPVYCPALFQSIIGERKHMFRQHCKEKQKGKKKYVPDLCETESNVKMFPLSVSLSRDSARGVPKRASL